MLKRLLKRYLGIYDIEFDVAKLEGNGRAVREWHLKLESEFHKLDLTEIHKSISTLNVLLKTLGYEVKELPACDSKIVLNKIVE